MLAKIFGSTKASSFAALFLLLTGLTTLKFLSPYSQVFPASVFSQGLPDLYLISMAALLLLWALLTVLYLNQLFIRYAFVHKNLYAGLFFALLIYSLPGLLKISPVLISFFFMILALNRLFAVQESKVAYSQLFDASFLVGIATIVYPPAIGFYLLVFISMFLYGMVSWRYWILSLLGFLGPFLFLAFILFWFDRPIAFPNLFLSDIVFPLRGEKNSLIKSTTIPLISALALLLIVSAQKVLRTFSKLNIDSRKGFSILFYMALITIVSSILSSSAGLFLFMAIPLAAGMAYYFQSLKRNGGKTCFLSCLPF